MCRSKKTSKLRVAGLCVGNSPGTGEFPAQMASNAENVSIWWRHHVMFVESSHVFYNDAFININVYTTIKSTTPYIDICDMYHCVDSK